VDEMLRYCGSSACRHRSLVEYFGQEWTGRACNACDMCDADAPAMGLETRRRGPGPFDPRLYQLLRNVRREIADTRGVPATAIASDSALRDLAAARPGSLAEVRRIPGMGRAGLAAWGGRFLMVFREFGE